MPTSGNAVASVTVTAAGNGGTGGTINTKKFGEPLFGPSIGSVSSGPGWTASTDKKTVVDELTQETVNGWIEKSKEPSNPTTTLQALVNLKRPTLRLSPLSPAQDDGVNSASSEPLHLHGLEFVYDCDAPKCGIYVNVVLPRNHPDAPPAAAVSQTGFARLQVFELIQDGGFGNKLTIEDGAVLELGRFEHGTELSAAVNNREASQSEHVSNERKTTGEGVNGNGTHHRRRFSHFHFRKRRSISGPALTVVDAERANNGSTNALQPGSTGVDDGKVTTSKHKDDDGVKVTIRLIALDEQETELASPNEQTTYLHIVRFGAKPEVKEEGEKDKVEDSRPWVVKVVKREATIGPHTFHLHEIYGLTSSSASVAPTVPPASHTYPPDPSGNIETVQEESPQSECLLCLSSPREVVLLPCRHLVACKECALNMVEFGAGGNITLPSESVGADAAGVPGGEGSATGSGRGVDTGAPATAATPATPNPRRKKKAKGWFCPVCRQPYTSMLRLTTTAPPMPEPEVHDKGEVSGTEDEDEGEARTPRPSSTGAATVAGSFIRGGFLRNLSTLGRERDRPTDVENQNTTRGSGT